MDRDKVEEFAAYYERWAADIRKMNGASVDADHADNTARLLRSLQDSVEAGQRFKAYVHERLDEAGVSTHPEGPHSAAGCRVGDRLDEVLIWGRYVPQPAPKLSASAPSEENTEEEDNTP